MMKVVATETPNTLAPEQPDAKPSLLLRLATWLKSKLGSMAIVKPVDAETENIVPDKVWKYKFSIQTGAGIIKGSINAANAEKAKEDVLVNYVRKLAVKVELVGEVTAK